ncbi:MAG TPA: hypothetical protein VMV48_06120 [Gallionellaceae bacterium]|nr:hypothetical protein [Gallionellaceae bacterium]
MKKTDIEKFRIDIVSGNLSALSMMLCRDGAIGRQGSGKLPADEVSVLGSSDGSIFNSLIDQLDERVFPHADVYDHPHKIGVPITYSIVFLGQGQDTAVFEFRFGSETPDVGELLPYFDGFISQAVALTNDWYAEEKANITLRR